MKKHLLFLASMLMVFGSIFAQEPVKYQRSSLHMVLLTTDEPITDDPELIPLIEQAYQNYPFPDKYNNHEIDFKTANAGKPKGGLIATMNQLWDYNTHTSKLPSTPKELKALKEALGGGGKKYLEQLKTNIDVQIKQNDVARKLVMKWYNIQPDGSNDANLLVERSAFNMNSSDVQTAAATAGGAQEIVNQVAEELINTTFVVFSKIDFYKNEATAGVTRDITIALAKIAYQVAAQKNQNLAQIIYSAAETGAIALYEATKDGYTALTNTLLYKLKWNDSIQAVFYQCYKDDGKIDMDKFNAINFELEFIGADNCKSSTKFAGNKGKDILVNTTIIRNLDKQFVKLQKDYEIFRPVAPIISLDPFLADMGTKEGLSGGEKFDVLTRAIDPKTGKMVYEKVGTVKVDKKGVWDNNYNMAEGNIIVTPSPKRTEDGRNGTLLSKCKKAQMGMVVRQKK